MESYFDPLSGELDQNLEWIKNGKNSGSHSRKEILNGLLATGLIHSKRLISILIKPVSLWMIENLPYSR